MPGTLILSKSREAHSATGARSGPEYTCVNGSAAVPARVPVLLFSGWINRQQQEVIDYLVEGNRILGAADGPRRVRLTNDQRRRLGADQRDVSAVLMRRIQTVR
jgi:hypothetical protein